MSPKSYFFPRPIKYVLMFGGTEEGEIKFLFSPATLIKGPEPFSLRCLAYQEYTLNSLNNSVTISVAFNHDSDICFHWIVAVLDDSVEIAWYNAPHFLMRDNIHSFHSLCRRISIIYSLWWERKGISWSDMLQYDFCKNKWMNFDGNY